MKRNRDKEERLIHWADPQSNKNPLENILVFLVLAGLLLAASLFRSHQLYFLEKAAPGPPAKEAGYIWITGSAGLSDGLYLVDRHEPSSVLAALNSLVADKSGQGWNSNVAAVQLNGGRPRHVDLPPEVANIFFQPISINRAEKNILVELPGIGPVLAERIVRHRNRHGPFRSKDELQQVTGIGPKKFAGLVQRITLD